MANDILQPGYFRFDGEKTILVPDIDAGATGPTGTAGPTGATGPAGETGATGSLSGPATGDLDGYYPNPDVVDLTISSEEHGSVLFYDGTNWVQLETGNDGYVLTTHGDGYSPTWEVSTGSGNSTYLYYDDFDIHADGLHNYVAGSIYYTSNQLKSRETFIAPQGRGSTGGGGLVTTLAADLSVVAGNDSAHPGFHAISSAETHANSEGATITYSSTRVSKAIYSNSSEVLPNYGSGWLGLNEEYNLIFKGDTGSGSLTQWLAGSFIPKVADTSGVGGAVPTENFWSGLAQQGVCFAFVDGYVKGRVFAEEGGTGLYKYKETITTSVVLDETAWYRFKIAMPTAYNADGYAGIPGIIRATFSVINCDTNVETWTDTIEFDQAGQSILADTIDESTGLPLGGGPYYIKASEIPRIASLQVWKTSPTAATLGYVDLMSLSAESGDVEHRGGFKLSNN